MARTGAKVTYYIKLGRNIPGFGVKYAWNGRSSDYAGVAKEFGVETAKAKEDGLIFGANNPKPSRVRVYTENGKTYLRWCDTGLVDSLTLRGNANGKTFMGSKVKRVSQVRG
jgi:hypothetical protein